MKTTNTTTNTTATETNTTTTEATATETNTTEATETETNTTATEVISDSKKHFTAYKVAINENKSLTLYRLKNYNVSYTLGLSTLTMYIETSSEVVKFIKYLKFEF